ncbi:MAG: carboxymuconolactone decarboxylase family protein [Bacillota bacterium]|uniref:Carboxymuconolactone decarboxylase family protein n=1 Tax=Virgibacillus salarius TaxID=447199 RepID=A0A941I9W8_9BACI|nr:MULTISPECIES: carboxymuconolactone decarboxylase family protein [Bacillaceae]MBR7797209.1 carboxymuconolactone decarboxylase family protein [Virgibacillus salarius]MDY7045985.1 carboxymuconolactone decarboxylase family protein [Virgibacillus sp. M23]NAZ09918.1 carboxymuconolactone decarboxylase family protein [Agaribacter marinus]WBX81049.1 carboxymuconolactone decarboxylase family protein [Virgibacillus salarius]
MEQRINYQKTSPEIVKLLVQLEEYKKKTAFDLKLIELIKIRVSQMNGCAFCIDMHTKDARAIGETEQRIYCLQAWREAPFYTETERAALALAEAVTAISVNGVPDKLYKQTRMYFDEKQYIDLVALIITINCWNRLSISVNNVPGNYSPVTAK